MGKTKKAVAWIFFFAVLHQMTRLVPTLYFFGIRRERREERGERREERGERREVNEPLYKLKN